MSSRDSLVSLCPISRILVSFGDHTWDLTSFFLSFWPSWCLRHACIKIYDFYHILRRRKPFGKFCCLAWRIKSLRHKVVESILHNMTSWSSWRNDGYFLIIFSSICHDVTRRWLRCVDRLNEFWVLTLTMTIDFLTNFDFRSNLGFWVVVWDVVPIFYIGDL